MVVALKQASANGGLPEGEITAGADGQDPEGRRPRGGALIPRNRDRAGDHGQAVRPEVLIVDLGQRVLAVRRQHDGVRPAASSTPANGVVGVGRGNGVHERATAADIDGGGQRRRLAERQQQRHTGQ